MTAPAGQPRTGEPATGPVHVTGEVVSVKRSGAYHHLTVLAGAAARRHRPGCFVAVSVGGALSARLARRCFWVHQARATGAYGATLELVVEVAGPGTRWLAGLRQGDPLEVTGPLGRPFALPAAPTTCTLVGHGYASAALFALADRLRERGCVVHMVLESTDEAHLFGTLAARRAARTVVVVTADGSVGMRGDPGELLGGLLGRQDTDVVYAVGPARFLHGVASAAEQHGAWSQTAVEAPMRCGVGSCGSCVLPVVGEDGVTRMVPACTAGAVFRGDRVRWEDIGTVPASARGAEHQ